jgi:non-ribosomal peptide synthetase component E (peptide arylation enzyme)
VAEAFIAKGIHKDDIVMIQFPNTWEVAMLYLAITRAGALISPMPMQWRFSDLDFIAGMTDAVAIITVEEFGGFSHGEMERKIQTKHPSGDPRDDQGRGHRKTACDHHRSQQCLHPLLVLRDDGGAQGMSAQPQQLAVVYSFWWC